jgi:hypothetical protein
VLKCIGVLFRQSGAIPAMVTLPVPTTCLRARRQRYLRKEYCSNLLSKPVLPRSNFVFQNDVLLVTRSGPPCCRHDTTGKTPAVFQKQVNPSAQK